MTEILSNCRRNLNIVILIHCIETLIINDEFCKYNQSIKLKKILSLGN